MDEANVNLGQLVQRLLSEVPKPLSLVTAVFQRRWYGPVGLRWYP